MQDARWLQLRERLIHRGWTPQDNALHAPHDTMWFSSGSDNANLTAFRKHMTEAAAASAAFATVDIDHAALHEDLVSLVEVLDELFAN